LSDGCNCGWWVVGDFSMWGLVGLCGFMFCLCCVGWNGGLGVLVMFWCGCFGFRCCFGGFLFLGDSGREGGVFVVGLGFWVGLGSFVWVVYLVWAERVAFLFGVVGC